MGWATDRRHGFVAVMVLAGSLIAGCASSDSIELEDLGLAIDVDIRAGHEFEVAVPIDQDTMVSIAHAPHGVTATLSPDADGTSIRLRVTVDAETPRGDHALALLANRDGEDFEFGWPFEVIGPAAP